MLSKARRRAGLKLAAVLLTLGLTGCTATPAPAPSTPTASVQPTATFTFGTGSIPQGLDPAVTTDIESFRVTRQILEGLVGVDPVTGAPSPLLATSWQELNDGLSYGFTLRQGVKFQDGQPFNAAAVCANFDRWFNLPATMQSDPSALMFKTVFRALADNPRLSIYKNCQVTSDSEVRINLNERFTGFLQAMTLPAFGISSPKALKDSQANQLTNTVNGHRISAYASHPVGTGPFSMVSWEGNAVTLTSNKDYWGDRGQIGTIKFVAMEHPQTRLQALLDGTIDGYDLVTVGNFDQLVKRGFQIVQRDPFSVMYLGINQASGPLSNLKVRQALSMAIDKDTLIRKFFIDGTASASQFLPPKLSGFNQSAPSLTYDPDKAKKLLADAGYKGEELKFYYPLNVTRAYLPTPEKIYAEISRELVAVGFNIKPVPVDWNDGYLQKVQSPGDHALHLLGWNGLYSDPDNFLATMFGELNGEFGYQDAQTSTKIDRARGLPNGPERTALYQTISSQLAQDIPAVPIAFPISALAMSDRVVSYPASPVLSEVFNKIKLKG